MQQSANRCAVWGDTVCAIREPIANRCAVWERELDFAAAAAAGDRARFAEHVHPNAAFVEGDGALRKGRDTIVASWEPILAGTEVRLYWHPTAVVLDEASGVALSRGPYLLENLKPNATERYRIGTFQSVWVKGDDGVFRVLFDGGTPPPVAATPEQAARLRAELRAPCAP